MMNGWEGSMETCLILGLLGERFPVSPHLLKSKKTMTTYVNFICIIYIVCSKEQDLVQTLSCLSMIITPAFAEVSTDSLALDIYVKKSGDFKCYYY